MKKYIFPAAFAALLALLLLALLSPPRRLAFYPRAGIVTALDRSADLVTVTDAAGYDWQFTGVEDWERGDLAALLMDDNGTPDSILDDRVTEVRYSGTMFDFLQEGGGPRV